MQKLKKAVIREDLLAITGDYKLAITLHQLMYWTERVGIKRYEKFEKEEQERNISEVSNLEGGWIYKTAEELSEETLLNVSASTIRRYIKKLIKQGYVLERKNPKVKFDQTKQYRINLLKIANDMFEQGYILQGYSFSWLTDSIFQNEKRDFQNENCNFENENAIPEITTDTTKTNNNKRREISKKFQQIFEIKLTLETFDELLDIYQDLDIIYHAILVTERRTKGTPAINYLIKTLKSWKENGLTDISSINHFLEKENWKDKKKNVRSKTKNNKKSKKETKRKEMHEFEKLQERGWNT